MYMYLCDSHSDVIYLFFSTPNLSQPLTQWLQSDIFAGIKQSCSSLMSLTHLNFAINSLANSLNLFQTTLCGICFEK